MPFQVFGLFSSIEGKMIACNVVGGTWSNNNLVTLDDWDAQVLTFGSMKRSNLTLDACDVPVISLGGTKMSDCTSSPLLISKSVSS